MKKTLSTTIVVLFLATLTTVAIAASAIPIVDGIDLFFKPETWDDPGHFLAGLQVERDEGSINFVLPKHPGGNASWAIHAFVTFFDAEVSSMHLGAPFDAEPWDWYYKLEADGDNGFIGQTTLPNGIITYDDEVDWSEDGAKVILGNPRGATEPNEIEMWMAAAVGRDAFTAYLSYGDCPMMKIELVDDGDAGGLTSFGGAQFNFQIGDTAYPFGAIVPLADCVGIDIKPGDYPNKLNINGHGVIPVAILGNADFDVTQINPHSLFLSGLAVRVNKKGKAQCSIADVSGDYSSGMVGAPDGYDDLLCKFADVPEAWTAVEGVAILTGELDDGTIFQGTDEFSMVH